ncbi:MAG: NAD-dependent epimerase/dehydratase family protein, partial [Chloroflexi bacterium]|nr:NAD-dependent epimerase/dehydratase family protein [Chloroflexota bacterium]
MRQPEVLIVGLGGVGSWVLELLARIEGISYIVGADFNEDWGRRKVNTVASGVVLQGYYPRLEFVRIDLRDVDATAETIDRLQPQLIFNCATLQTWWVRHQYLTPEKA